MAHRTSFAHTKGGTGKTTAAVNVAGFLAKKGERVLLVDGDPEGHASRNLGLGPEDLEASLDDLLLDEDGVKPVKRSNCIYPTRYGVDVVPGDTALHETYQHVFDDRHETLEEALVGIEERYDHVVIDTPSSYRDVIAAALKASQDYYLVLDPSMFSQQGAQILKQFLRTLPDRHSLRINPTGAIYLENVDKGPVGKLRERFFGSDHQTSERLARDLFGSRLVTLPYCGKVVDSQDQGRPLSHFDPVPEAMRPLEDIAEDLIEYSARFSL